MRHQKLSIAGEIGLRVLYGLDHVPDAMPGGLARLPGVTLSAAKLRLNTVPMPADRLAGASAVRMAVIADWLVAASGDYGLIRRRFIARYMDFIAAQLRRHHAELASRLLMFDGLYAVEDWGFSALRPLPRAWLPIASGLAPVDFAFWDGIRVIAVLLGAARPQTEAMLTAAGHLPCRIDSSELNGDGEDVITRLLPDSLQEFWVGERLPMTPFRRDLPGVLDQSVSSST